MHPHIYIPGDFADDLGALNLQKIADFIAEVSKQPVDVLTMGPSEHHSHRRYPGKPDA